MSSRKRNTTVDAAVAAISRHALVRAAEDTVLCSCGSWFSAADGFTRHQTQSMRSELAAYRTRRPVTGELLEQVAEAFQSAPDRQRQAAVAALLGCSTQSASYYVHRARQEGLIRAPDPARPVTRTPRMPDACAVSRGSR